MQHLSFLLLEPAALNSDVAPILIELKQTIAVITFQQAAKDVPPGCENHYFYQLLYKTPYGTFEILSASDSVYHMVTGKGEQWNGKPIVTITARNLSLRAEYTFKYQTYRTHRDVCEKGPTDDVMTINITTELGKYTSIFCDRDDRAFPLNLFCPYFA